jgi:hypothetical protein
MKELLLSLCFTVLVFSIGCGEDGTDVPSVDSAPTLGLFRPIGKISPPELDSDSWIMVEIWPDVQDVTLTAYFLDSLNEKNRNLCEATKRVFDRDQDAKVKAGGTFSSYRECLSVTDARSRGYFRSY